MPTKRPPAGAAGGAAGGLFPNISVGNPPIMGLSIHDEFLRLGSAGDYGDTRLSISTIGGAPTPTLVAPSSQLEAGVLRLTTTTTSNEGGALENPTTVYSAGPAIGGKYTAKLRAVDTSAIEVWSGFASSVTGTVDTADATEFIGFRYVGSGWEGVVKDGATSGGETTVSLVALADDAFHVLGFHYVEMYTETATAWGVQFFTVDADMHGSPSITNVGDLVTTNIPTAALYLVPLGIVTQTTAAKACEMDFYSLGGNTRR